MIRQIYLHLDSTKQLNRKLELIQYEEYYLMLPRQQQIYKRESIKDYNQLKFKQ